MRVGSSASCSWREVSFGSELSDPLAKFLDQRLIQHQFELYALYAGDQHTMRINASDER